MGTRIHLYALPGLPLRLEDLMPQALLARCAGNLLAQGHTALVHDAGSVEQLAIPEIDDLLPGCTPPQTPWRQAFSGESRRAARALARFRSARIKRLLQDDRWHEAPRIAAIQIQRRKDVPDARELAEALHRAHPGLRVCIIGEWASAFARILLANAPEFDLACTAPPESVLASLARNVDDPDRWRQIPGLLYRSDATARTATLRTIAPLPDVTPANYHPTIYPALLDGGKLKLFTLVHSTGLDHVGHYRGEWEQHAVHVRDPRRLRAEALDLHELYGARAFHITGMHTPRNAIAQLAAEYRTLPFDIVYGREAHVHALDAETFAALSYSGCRAVTLSLLTGSQHLLSDFFGENWTISQVEACFRQCRGRPIHLHADLVFPCPPDDFHTRAETFRLLRRCQPASIALALPQLLPGSAWYQYAPDFHFGVGLRRLQHWAARPTHASDLFAEAAQLPYYVGSHGQATAARVDTLLRELNQLDIPRYTAGVGGVLNAIASEHGSRAPGIDTIERDLLHLELPRLHDTVELFNERASASINAVDLFPPGLVQEAVGN